MTVLGNKGRPAEEQFDAAALYGTYSDADWQKIKKSLAGNVGVNLDETTINLELPDIGRALERPLRDALQGLAWYYGAASRLNRPLTPKQQAAELRKGLAKLRIALDVIYSVGGHADAVRLAYTLTRMRRRYDKLAVMGNRSHDNARKTHVQYWQQLALLWRAILANNRRRRHKDLHSFLLACSVPVFPKATTEKALVAFVDRSFLQTSR